jgi:hypothetical protein
MPMINSPGMDLIFKGDMKSLAVFSFCSFQSFGVIVPVLNHRKDRGNELQGNCERKIQLRSSLFLAKNFVDAGKWSKDISP